MIVASGKYDVNNWEVWEQQLGDIIAVKKDISLVKPY